MMYQSIFLNYEGFDTNKRLLISLNIKIFQPEVNKNYQQRGIILPNLSTGYKSKICY